MIAILHFTLETFYTLRFGQTVAGYLPDLIAVSLLVVGATLTLKDFNAIGILCGAWGFAFCLHYRSWAWRFDDVMDGSATELIETTMYVLEVTELKNYYDSKRSSTKLFAFLERGRNRYRESFS